LHIDFLRKFQILSILLTENIKKLKMNKQQLQDALIDKYESFTYKILSIDEKDFLNSKDSTKWSPGQIIDHIHRSVSPLSSGMSLPKWLIKAIFKKANRPSISYEEVVEKYLEVLKEGGKASGRYIPKTFVKSSTQIPLGKKLRKKVAILAKSLNKYSEQELDMVAIPHPLMGLLTIREMMYFTIYHVQHHEKQIA
jgi:Protein of unknown function (DUF1569)